MDLYGSDYDIPDSQNHRNRFRKSRAESPWYNDLNGTISSLRLSRQELDRMSDTLDRFHQDTISRPTTPHHHSRPQTPQTSAQTSGPNSGYPGYTTDNTPFYDYTQRGSIGSDSFMGSKTVVSPFPGQMQNSIPVYIDPVYISRPKSVPPQNDIGPAKPSKDMDSVLQEFQTLLSKELEAVQEENEILRQNNDDLQRSLAYQSNELETMQPRYRQVETDLSTANQYIDEMVATVERLEDQRCELQISIELQNSELKSLSRQVEEEQEKRRQQNLDIQDKDWRLQELTKDRENLMSEKDEMGIEYDELKHVNVALRNECEELLRNLAIAEQEADRLRNQLRDTRMDMLDARLTDHEATRRELEHLKDVAGALVTKAPVDSQTVSPGPEVVESIRYRTTAAAAIQPNRPVHSLPNEFHEPNLQYEKWNELANRRMEIQFEHQSQTIDPIEPKTSISMAERERDLLQEAYETLQKELKEIKAGLSLYQDEHRIEKEKLSTENAMLRSELIYLQSGFNADHQGSRYNPTAYRQQTTAHSTTSEDHFIRNSYQPRTESVFSHQTPGHRYPIPVRIGPDATMHLGFSHKAVQVNWNSFNDEEDGLSKTEIRTRRRSIREEKKLSSTVAQLQCENSRLKSHCEQLEAMFDTSISEYPEESYAMTQDPRSRQMQTEVSDIKQQLEDSKVLLKQQEDIIAMLQNNFDFDGPETSQQLIAMADSISNLSAGNTSRTRRNQATISNDSSIVDGNLATKTGLSSVIYDNLPVSTAPLRDDVLDNIRQQVQQFASESSLNTRAIQTLMDEVQVLLQDRQDISQSTKEIHRNIKNLSGNWDEMSMDVQNQITRELQSRDERLTAIESRLAVMLARSNQSEVSTGRKGASTTQRLPRRSHSSLDIVDNQSNAAGVYSHQSEDLVRHPHTGIDRQAGRPHSVTPLYHNDPPKVTKLPFNSEHSRLNQGNQTQLKPGAFGLDSGYHTGASSLISAGPIHSARDSITSTLRRGGKEDSTRGSFRSTHEGRQTGSPSLFRERKPSSASDVSIKDRDSPKPGLHRHVLERKISSGSMTRDFALGQKVNSSPSASPRPSHRKNREKEPRSTIAKSSSRVISISDSETTDSGDNVTQAIDNTRRSKSNTRLSQHVLRGDIGKNPAYKSHLHDKNRLPASDTDSSQCLSADDKLQIQNVNQFDGRKHNQKQERLNDFQGSKPTNSSTPKRKQPTLDSLKTSRNIQMPVDHSKSETGSDERLPATDLDNRSKHATNNHSNSPKNRLLDDSSKHTKIYNPTVDSKGAHYNARNQLVVEADDDVCKVPSQRHYSDDNNEIKRAIDEMNKSRMLKTYHSDVTSEEDSERVLLAPVDISSHKTHIESVQSPEPEEGHFQSKTVTDYTRPEAEFISDPPKQIDQHVIETPKTVFKSWRDEWAERQTTKDSRKVSSASQHDKTYRNISTDANEPTDHQVSDDGSKYVASLPSIGGRLLITTENNQDSSDFQEDDVKLSSNKNRCHLEENDAKFISGTNDVGGVVLTDDRKLSADKSEAKKGSKIAIKIQDTSCPATKTPLGQKLVDDEIKYDGSKTKSKSKSNMKDNIKTSPICSSDDTESISEKAPFNEEDKNKSSKRHIKIPKSNTVITTITTDECLSDDKTDNKGENIFRNKTQPMKRHEDFLIDSSNSKKIDDYSEDVKNSQFDTIDGHDIEDALVEASPRNKKDLHVRETCNEYTGYDEFSDDLGSMCDDLSKSLTVLSEKQRHRKKRPQTQHKLEKINKAWENDKKDDTDDRDEDLQRLRKRSSDKSVRFTSIKSDEDSEDEKSQMPSGRKTIRQKRSKLSRDEHDYISSSSEIISDDGEFSTKTFSDFQKDTKPRMPGTDSHGASNSSKLSPSTCRHIVDTSVCNIVSITDEATEPIVVDSDDLRRKKENFSEKTTGGSKAKLHEKNIPVKGGEKSPFVQKVIKKILLPDNSSISEDDDSCNSGGILEVSDDCERQKRVPGLLNQNTNQRYVENIDVHVEHISSIDTCDSIKRNKENDNANVLMQISDCSVKRTQRYRHGDKIGAHLDDDLTTHYLKHSDEQDLSSNEDSCNSGGIIIETDDSDTCKASLNNTGDTIIDNYHQNKTDKETPNPDVSNTKIPTKRNINKESSQANVNVVSKKHESHQKQIEMKIPQRVTEHIGESISKSDTEEEISGKDSCDSGGIIIANDGEISQRLGEICESDDSCDKHVLPMSPKHKTANEKSMKTDLSPRSKTKMSPRTSTRQTEKIANEDKSSKHFVKTKSNTRTADFSDSENSDTSDIANKAHQRRQKTRSKPISNQDDLNAQSIEIDGNSSDDTIVGEDTADIHELESSNTDSYNVENPDATISFDNPSKFIKKRSAKASKLCDNEHDQSSIQSTDRNQPTNIVTKRVKPGTYDDSSDSTTQENVKLPQNNRCNNKTASPDVKGSFVTRSNEFGDSGVFDLSNTQDSVMSTINDPRRGSCFSDDVEDSETQLYDDDPTNPSASKGLRKEQNAHLLQSTSHNLHQSEIKHLKRRFLGLNQPEHITSEESSFSASDVDEIAKRKVITAFNTKFSQMADSKLGRVESFSSGDSLLVANSNTDDNPPIPPQRKKRGNSQSPVQTSIEEVIYDIQPTWNENEDELWREDDEEDSPEDWQYEEDFYDEKDDLGNEYVDESDLRPGFGRGSFRRGPCDLEEVPEDEEFDYETTASSTNIDEPDNEYKYQTVERSDDEDTVTDPNEEGHERKHSRGRPHSRELQHSSLDNSPPSPRRKQRRLPYATDKQGNRSNSLPQGVECQNFETNPDDRRTASLPRSNKKKRSPKSSTESLSQRKSKRRPQSRETSDVSSSSPSQISPRDNAYSCKETSDGIQKKDEPRSERPSKGQKPLIDNKASINSPRSKKPNPDSYTDNDDTNAKGRSIRRGNDIFDTSFDLDLITTSEDSESDISMPASKPALLPISPSTKDRERNLSFKPLKKSLPPIVKQLKRVVPTADDSPESSEEKVVRTRGLSSVPTVKSGGKDGFPFNLESSYETLYDPGVTPRSHPAVPISSEASKDDTEDHGLPAATLSTYDVDDETGSSTAGESSTWALDQLRGLMTSRPGKRSHKEGGAVSEGEGDVESSRSVSPTAFSDSEAIDSSSHLYMSSDFLPPIAREDNTSHTIASGCLDDEHRDGQGVLSSRSLAHGYQFIHQ